MNNNFKEKLIDFPVVLVHGFNALNFREDFDIHYYLPEYEQHPSEQTVWARNLLKDMCESNKQVWIFTQSDHILNGLRLAVKVDGHRPFSILFFDKANNPHQILVTENGDIGIWPDGFFTENMKSYSEMAQSERKYHAFK